MRGPCYPRRRPATSSDCAFPPGATQTVSGAQLQLTPGASGLFHLSISGGKAQVDAARSLVATVLQA